jgi:hypothetical protein
MEDSDTMRQWPNDPAGVDARFALLFAFDSHWPGTTQYGHWGNNVSHGLLEIALYLPVTGFLAYGFLRIPDFHHGLWLFYIVYLLLDLYLWTATYGVWADNPPEPVC